MKLRKVQLLVSAREFPGLVFNGQINIISVHQVVRHRVFFPEVGYSEVDMVGQEWCLVPERFIFKGSIRKPEATNLQTLGEVVDEVGDSRWMKFIGSPGFVGMYGYPEIRLVDDDVIYNQLF